MKKLALISFLTCMIVTGCGKLQADGNPVVIKTPSPAIVSETVASPTIRYVPSKNPTKTSHPNAIDKDFLYPTSTPMLNQACQEIPIKEYSPAQEIQGIIPLLAVTYTLEDSFLYDLQTEGEIPIPHKQSEQRLWENVAVSPNKKWFAYLPIGEFGEYENQTLIITDSKGEMINQIDLTIILEPVSWIEIGGWMDNGNIALIWGGEDSDGYIWPDLAITVILNPFTGEWQQYRSDYPGIFTIYPDYLSNWGNYGFSLSVYNQPLDRVLYLSYDGVVLWDLANEEQIKLFPSLPQDSITQPVWSLNGDYFVLDLDTETGRNLFLVSKDGKEKQVTYLQRYKEGEIIDFSWSPDESKIAFWLFTKKDTIDPTYYHYQLNILNISTQEISAYCVTGYNWKSFYPDWYPIWSPDGKYLLVAAQNETDAQRSTALLIDLVNERAYKLADDMIPLGWMVNE